MIISANFYRERWQQPFKFNKYKFKVILFIFKSVMCSAYCKATARMWLLSKEYNLEACFLYFIVPFVPLFIFKSLPFSIRKLISYPQKWKLYLLQGNCEMTMNSREKDMLVEQNLLPPNVSGGFPGSSVVKNLPARGGDIASIPGSGRSLE